MKSPSERFVSAVVGFIAGTHMYGKSRPSTFSLMHESLALRRQTKELNRSLAALQKKK